LGFAAVIAIVLVLVVASLPIKGVINYLRKMQVDNAPQGAVVIGAVNIRFAPELLPGSIQVRIPISNGYTKSVHIRTTVSEFTFNNQPFSNFNDSNLAVLNPSDGILLALGPVPQSLLSGDVYSAKISFSVDYALSDNEFEWTTTIEEVCSVPASTIASNSPDAGTCVFLKHDTKKFQS